MIKNRKIIDDANIKIIELVSIDGLICYVVREEDLPTCSYFGTIQSGSGICYDLWKKGSIRYATKTLSLL